MPFLSFWPRTDSPAQTKSFLNKASYFFISVTYCPDPYSLSTDAISTSWGQNYSTFKDVIRYFLIEATVIYAISLFNFFLAALAGTAMTKDTSFEKETLVLPQRKQ
jgi:hypothetical protein